MSRFLTRLRHRLPPAVVVAIGVGVLASGLLSYTRATEPAPTFMAIPSYLPLGSAGPDESAVAGDVPSFDPARVATRVAILRLGIDLPVVSRPFSDPGSPLCDVAMVDPTMGQPGAGRGTLIYGLSRTRMFRPLLLQSRIENGGSLLGLIVQVWTSDDWMFQYKITEVRRHQSETEDVASVGHEQLWLQAPEAQLDLNLWVQVVAEFVSAQPATHAEAAPAASPRACG